MPTPVSDSTSNKNEQLAHAAEVLTGAPNKLAVFEAIYKGKKQVKTRSDIEDATGLDNKQVLNAARSLADNQLVSQEKVGNQTAYRKTAFFARHKDKILALAKSPTKLASQPRSSHVRSKPGDSSIVLNVTYKVTKGFRPPRLVTIHEIDSFKKVRSVTGTFSKRTEVSEEYVKNGIQAILGENGIFKDWGGEINDIATTRVVIGGKRRATAIALKGPAQKGTLTPGKMGKNGDQIQRLFSSESADVFILQYNGDIGESVRTQMHALAVARAVSTQKEIVYAIIDGQDTQHLMKAYPEEFGDE